MFDVSTEANLFDNYVQPGIEAEITSESKIIDRVKKSDKLTLGGHTAEQKVLIKASQAARAANSAAYPSAQESTPGKTSVKLKRAQFFTLKFDGLALAAAKRTAASQGRSGGTPVTPVQFERDGIEMTIKNDLSRQAMMDGSGRLCQANGAGSSTTTLTVDSPYFGEATKFLKEDRVIDIYTGGGSSEVDSKGISSVDSDTQATLKASDSWSDDSWVYNEDVYIGSDALGQGEMMGLLGIASDADPPLAALQGLDVSTYPMWKAHVFGNSGDARPLSEDMIIAAVDAAQDFGNVSFMLFTRKLRRVWAAKLRDYKIFNTKLMWGGFSGLPFYYDGREIPMVPDKYVPDGTIIGGDESKLTLYVTDKNAWIQFEKGRDGGILQKVAGYNQYVAEGYFFGNLGVSVRKAFFRIEDIQEPSV